MQINFEKNRSKKCSGGVEFMNKKWWHGKVAYQIYPKSFKDTTGSGMGDIKGITSELDYLKGLGIDIIWLSPCYVSPLADEGYDIADYYKIDPRFGTNDDLWQLIAEAKKRDMYILMDLVVNHCSDEHEWFQKALADPNGKYAGYFYFEDAVDGHEPNNWRSYFGGSAWEKVPGTDKYYLHLFDKKQPDLNWNNQEMREEIYTMMNWWLDRGVAGFRLDAIMNIMKPLPLSDQNYEPDRSDGLATASMMIAKAKGIMDVLRQMRDRTFAVHNAFSVGEIFNETKEQIPGFIGEDGCFSSMFDFRETVIGQDARGWYCASPVTPDQYRDAVYETQRITGDVGMISTIIENHDEPRGVSHYIPTEDLSDTSKKFLAAMQFMQKGMPFIYQGQEIGMENIKVHSIDEVDDVSAKDEYKVARQAGCSDEEAISFVNRYSRDNARTPMQWDDTDNAGFTAGKPWLHVNPNNKTINVKAEENSRSSVLSWYRKLISLRKSKEYGDVVVYGRFEPWKAEEPELMAFYRKTADRTLLILGNFRKEKRELVLPKPVRKVILDNCAPEEESEFISTIECGSEKVTLQEYEAAIIEV